MSLEFGKLTYYLMVNYFPNAFSFIARERYSKFTYQVYSILRNRGLTCMFKLQTLTNVFVFSEWSYSVYLARFCLFEKVRFEFGAKTGSGKSSSSANAFKSPKKSSLKSELSFLHY